MRTSTAMAAAYALTTNVMATTTTATRTEAGVRPPTVGDLPCLGHTSSTRLFHSVSVLRPQSRNTTGKRTPASGSRTIAWPVEQGEPITLYLADSARAWLEHLPPRRIDSWAQLHDVFIGNFLGTYICPENPWDLRNCK